MRDFLRAIFISATAIASVAAFFPGLSYGNDILTLIIASLAFTLINFYLKPVIKLFLLPINLITLGMFRWLTAVICLFALTIIVPAIQVVSFQFAGLSQAGFALPPVHFGVLLSLITSSFLLSFTTGFITWLVKA